MGNFTFSRAYMLLNGYSVLAVNFTGSAGFGQDFMENLLGKIGTVDAQEIVGMVKQVIDQKKCDPKKVFMMGGNSIKFFKKN